MHRPHVFVRWRFALTLLALCVVLQPPAFAAGVSADARFDALGKRFVEEFGRYSPVSATQLGDHRFDRELDDLSASGRARTLAWTKGVLGELQAIDRSRLSRANQVDAAMLDNQLRYSIWSEESYRDWSWDPLVYTQLAGQSLYGLLAREFAPLPERLRSVTSRLEQLPDLLEQMRANIVPARVPAIHAETAIKQNPGVLSLVDELVVPNVARLPGATSVFEEAVRARVEAPPFARWVVEGITAVWEAVTSVEADWVERFALLSAHRPGDTIRFGLAGEEIEGAFGGFDERGFLKLETASGERRIRSGEIYSW